MHVPYIRPAGPSKGGRCERKTNDAAGSPVGRATPATSARCTPFLLVAAVRTVPGHGAANAVDQHRPRAAGDHRAGVRPHHGVRAPAQHDGRAHRCCDQGHRHRCRHHHRQRRVVARHARELRDPGGADVGHGQSRRPRHQGSADGHHRRCGRADRPAHGPGPVGRRQSRAGAGGLRPDRRQAAAGRPRHHTGAAGGHRRQHRARPGAEAALARPDRDRHRDQERPDDALQPGQGNEYGRRPGRGQAGDRHADAERPGQPGDLQHRLYCYDDHNVGSRADDQVRHTNVHLCPRPAPRRRQFNGPGIEP
jgi:hypothetical protein